MANQTKRRPNGFSDAELKAYDGLSKTEIFEVLGHVMRKGFTPSADLDLAKAIKAINAEINPAGSGDSGGASSDRILSAAQYLALTAISAHSGGMPATLYAAGVQKEHRESFQTRGFVKIGDGGAATVTPEGNKALDRYEAKAREKAAGAGGQTGGSGQAQGGAAPAPTPVPSPTPVAADTANAGAAVPTQAAQGAAPAAPAAAGTEGVGDFGG